MKLDPLIFFFLLRSAPLTLIPIPIHLSISWISQSWLLNIHFNALPFQSSQHEKVRKISGFHFRSRVLDSLAMMKKKKLNDDPRASNIIKQNKVAINTPAAYIPHLTRDNEIQPLNSRYSIAAAAAAAVSDGCDKYRISWFVAAVWLFPSGSHTSVYRPYIAAILNRYLIIQGNRYAGARDVSVCSYLNGHSRALLLIQEDFALALPLLYWW